MIAFSTLDENNSNGGDIKCPCGEIFVDENGVRIQVKGEDRVIETLLPWDQAPQALAALRVMSNGNHDADLYEIIESKMAELGATFEDVEHFIGLDDVKHFLAEVTERTAPGSLLGSIQESWHLSNRCPWASLHNELERVRGMSNRDVAQYMELSLM